MSKINVDDAFFRRLAFAMGSGPQFSYSLGDLYRYQCAGALRNFESAFSVELPPRENLILVPSGGLTDGPDCCL